jgi:hypothetical protein
MPELNRSGTVFARWRESEHAISDVILADGSHHSVATRRCPASRNAGTGPSSNTGWGARQPFHGGGIFHKPSSVSLAAAAPIDPALECPPASSAVFRLASPRPSMSVSWRANAITEHDIPATGGRRLVDDVVTENPGLSVP